MNQSFVQLVIFSKIVRHGLTDRLVFVQRPQVCKIRSSPVRAVKSWLRFARPHKVVSEENINLE